MPISGTVAGAGVTRYVVELFGNSDEKSDEAEFFLDDVAVSTDTNGHAVFTARLERSAADVKVRSVTATVTSAAGATSPLSRARAIVDSSPRSRKPPAR